VIGVSSFEWNGQKAQQNLVKHKVSFEEAQTVFDDPMYVIYYDPDHSDDEHRYLIIGESNQAKLLLVSYTERGDVIRIISARRVTARERQTYEQL
jgi:uncharacterized DUF497 family protein